MFYFFSPTFIVLSNTQNPQECPAGHPLHYLKTIKMQNNTGFYGLKILPSEKKIRPLQY